VLVLPPPSNHNYNNINKETCGFIGWSLSEILRKNIAGNGIGDECEKVLFIKNMIYTHEEAMGDVEYSSFHYSTFDMMWNNGGLTLIHPAYINFANELVVAMMSVINMDSFFTNKNSICADARQAIKDDERLYKLFKNSFNPIILHDKILEQVYKELVTKSCNARLGAEKKRFVEEKVGTCSKQTNSNFRETMKVESKRKAVHVAASFSTEAILLKKKKIAVEDTGGT
jgi:hypothetical protein